MQLSTVILKVCKLTDLGFSIREISARTGCGHSTITLIQRRYRSSGHDYASLEGMTDESLGLLFYPPSPSRKSLPLPDFKIVAKNITAPKAPSNLYIEWENYKVQYPEGYQYTQFKKYFHDWLFSDQGDKYLKMVVHRKAGENLYIDWAGDVLPLVRDANDPEKILDAHLFVTTLGVSSLIFAIALPDEKSPSAAIAMISALDFYGGLPQVFKPDNMKTAVTKNDEDGIVLSSLFSDLESFYDVPVIPAPPRKPKGKPSVENAVKYAEQRILSQLKGQTFISFNHLNEKIQSIVSILNNRVQRKTGKSRSQIFEEVDKPRLKPLPSGSYTTYEYKLSSVPDTYHIKFDEHYYSVPYILYSHTDPKQVIIKGTPFEVLICSTNNQLICKHKRNYSDEDLYATSDEHMPENHRLAKDIQERDSEFYLNWAKTIGPSMSELMNRILHRTHYPKKNLPTCASVMMRSQKCGIIKAEKAAANCLQNNIITYKYFKKAINGLDDHAEETENNMIHENIRGGDYYK